MCAALAGAGCANPAGAHECATGITCPADKQCAAAEPKCLDSNCGNGVMDPGEDCDDGNTKNGDGCSSSCLIEECGNGQLDTLHGEECDDGNHLDGDGCSHDCKIEMCGNGRVDTAKGEECDDNNRQDGDGCSHDCKFEFCGDGIKNDQTSHSHEDCDTAGNSATCNFNCTTSTCGDGIVNPLYTSPGAAGPEQCDPPSVANGCSADCRFEHCGNGVVDPGEECDGAAGLQPCSAICHQERCGNAILDPGEQCDDGNIADNDGCSHNCKFEFCGDGIKNDQTSHSHEDCDTAGNSATCNLNCTTPVCGDGIVNPLYTSPGAAGPEQCDPPSVANGCSVDCRFERCGNGMLDPQEQCDGTLGQQPCNTATCLTERCGNGIFDDDATTGVHEQCDDDNINDNDGCSHDCKLEFCGDGATNNHEACDPTDPLFGAAGCNSDCTKPKCGDFKLNTAAGEQCDDGNNLDGDGCSATCHVERCGNGMLDLQEQCDGTLGQQPCNTATCLTERCGNGIFDDDATTGVHEQCDDGNINDNDGCSQDCKLEFCGDGIKNDQTSHSHEDCDTASNSATCNINCTIPACGDGIVNPLYTSPGAAGPEQCDPPSVGNGCSADCRFEHCGNGVVDPGEQCDDDNTTPGDGCFNCHLEQCGNGIVDQGEQCDPYTGTPDPYAGAAAADGVACDADCTAVVCGDGHTNTLAGEACDDGNNDACGTCTVMCGAPVEPVAAEGSILVTPPAGANVLGGANVLDGDTFTLRDGVAGHPAVVFEFDSNGAVAAGHVEIAFTLANTSTELATAMRDAINASAVTLDVTATIGATVAGKTALKLVNDHQSALGNQPIDAGGAIAGHFVFQALADGAAGDCATGVGCMSGADCASGVCNAMTNRCE
jgi:cysteine-rich repeat protein